MHTDFILSDVFEILDDAIMASSSINQNIANYPICDYILQSVFLRLTGYQEQKLKCILWEMASDDFDFRYKYLNGSINVGECSRLEDKDKVYCELIKILEDKGHKFPIPDEDETNRQISKIRENLIHKFETSIFRQWLPREYSRFVDFSGKIKYQINGYFSGSGIFGGDNNLNESFKKLYKHRNRCAHNLLSYQNNVPKLHDLVKDNDGADNYFTRILLICLIDNVFTSIYRYYYNNKVRSSDFYVKFL